MRIFCSLLFLLLSTTTAAAEPVRVIDDFDNGLDAQWETKAFHGLTIYETVAEEKGQVLRADSRGTASGLVYKIDYSLDDYPYLLWRWKIAHVLEKGDARHREGDDYPARLYVIFSHWFFPKTRSINYIWANRLPPGTFLANAFVGNAVMLAAESGDQKAGQWLEEARNVRDDFRRIFGEDPPRVGAIAIMTDTDNTGETATAWYDDIRLSADGKR